MNKCNLFRGCFFIGLLSFFVKYSVPQQGIIPIPVEYKKMPGTFAITGSVKIILRDGSVKVAGELLRFYIKELSGKQLVMSTATAGKNAIILKLDTETVSKNEGYRLEISNRVISLTAHDLAGAIYGIQTLRQMWRTGKNNSLLVPAATINDFPRFAYRGMALDVSRHMFPVSFIKKYIDLLSLYKLNTFHWHLTDDQGWRIEIKKYPKLQSVAAWRDETLIGHKRQLPHKFDGKKYGGFYSQDEVKQIVQYATARNITIIPEIEMPGHAMAALAAYPALGCTGGPYKTATFWGVFEDVFCAGNDSTFNFLENVLDEVMQLFPSSKIHIGGDESPKTRWHVCPKCQKRMQELKLPDEHALQSYFVQRIEKYINSKNRKIIGWDEILEGGLAPNATVMSWRGEEGGIAAAAQQHEVIMTPESYFYFDYYQSLYKGESLAAGGYTPLQKVYSYEPVSDTLKNEVKRFITGVEGQAWSEYFTSQSQAEFMIFPRLAALAEIAWSEKKQKNYPDFLSRLRLQSDLLAQLKVNAASNFDELVWHSSNIENGYLRLSLESTLPGAVIRYTIDGKEPGAGSKIYTESVKIKKSCTLKAQLTAGSKPVLRKLAQAFYISKSTGARVTLTNSPIARFNTNPAALVNGIAGNDTYNDMQWLGFSGDNLEATIDLGFVQAIHSVGINFLNYHWQKMWPPTRLLIYAGDDTTAYKLIYEQKDFSINGINKVQATIAGCNARFVKVIGENAGIIPAGEYGAGGKALLLADEILIE